MALNVLSRTAGGFEIAVSNVPITMSDVCLSDAHITGLWVHNGTSGPITFYLQDRQSTPMPLPFDGNQTTLAGDAILNAPFGIMAQGGFTAWASAPGLVFTVTWI